MTRPAPRSARRSGTRSSTSTATCSRSSTRPIPTCARPSVPPFSTRGWSAARSRGLSQRPRTLDERRRTRTPQGAWWGARPRRTRCDRATATLPALLYERMDELGIDFAVLYPTKTLVTGRGRRRPAAGLCRGFNDYYADVYRPFADRMTVAGMIPMHTPEEAVAELHHCHELGPEGRCASPRACSGRSPSRRARPLALALAGPDPLVRLLRPRQRVRLRPGVGGVRRARLRRHLPRRHDGAARPALVDHQLRRQPRRAFAREMYPLCKSLFFGGVTARFPDLPFAFLECGVWWACSCCATPSSTGRSATSTRWCAMDPATLDRDELER